MSASPDNQRDHAVALLSQRGMARLGELTSAGITATTLSRMAARGEVVRLARGLYQLPDAPLDAHHTFAEAAKLVPRGVICGHSALAFHDLIDRIPLQIWMAIGAKDWRPRIESLPVQIVRFGDRVFASGIEQHKIEGVTVRIYGAAKAVVDEFRMSRQAGILYANGVGYDLSTAIAALKATLRQRKATPAEIARFAHAAGPKVWEFLRPYLETLTADG